MFLFKSLGMETPNSLKQYFPNTNLVECSFCYEFIKKKKKEFSQTSFGHVELNKVKSKCLWLGFRELSIP